MDTTTQPAAVQMTVHGGAVVFTRDGHELWADQFRTPAEAIAMLAHLADKSWVTREHLAGIAAHACVTFRCWR